jgi:protein TonB
MVSLFSMPQTKTSPFRGQLLSVAAHLALLLAVAGGIGRSARIVPYRLPGTAMGVSTLTYYSPGSPQLVASDSAAQKQAKTKAARTLKHIPDAPKVETGQVAKSETGIGTSAKSGLGEGDITIALQQYFPYPTPSLASLPHGKKGDVILDAVIDEHGNVAQLTLVQGLGAPIDQDVIATVQQWHYTPAMKNGVPVASEQELHFHYERG